jgi:uroporphyrin-3 C-methyltransferase
MPDERSGVPSPVVTRIKPGMVLAVALLGVGLTVWNWLADRQESRQLELEWSRKLAELDAVNKESRLLAAHAQEGTREALVKLGVLESKYAESQNQRLALEALYQDLSRNRDEWLLTEVEQLLLTANEQLQLAGNLKAALIALQTADSRLQASERPQYLPLRKIITQDIQRLQAVPHVDTPGITLRLDALANAVDSLPLALAEEGSRAVRVTQTPPAEGAWARLVQEFWQDMRQLVRIRRLENPDAPLVNPSQEWFMRENLKLRILSARVALMQHDELNYRADMAAIEAALNRYFDTRTPATRNALATLKQVSSATIVASLPDVSAGLGVLRNLKLSRDRGGR